MSHEPEVADTDESRGKHMQEETAQEFVGGPQW
jgi:hypothetical protein